MTPARAIAEDHVETMQTMRFAPWEIALSVLPAGAVVPSDITEEDAVLFVMAAWLEIAKHDRRAAA